MCNKKSKLFLIVLFVCLAVIVGVSCVACNFDVMQYEQSKGFAGEVKSASAVSGDIVNAVVLICFAGENVEQVRSSFTQEIRSYFVGQDNSLKDYYNAISYGSIDIDTIFPEKNGNIYVYQSTKTRSYYSSITEKTSYSKRYYEESLLLNSAISGANAYFNYQGKNLDTNNDGYVDSVSFLVSGKDTSGSGWGGLLWPHSWELAEISRLAGRSTESLNGITVNKYSFNFLQSVDVGFLCHETGHVFGMPDLYHYNYDTSSKQVEAWDIMHRNTTIPQYPTVYMRDKYLNVIGDNQIVDLKKDGEYSLKPTSIATKEDILAYRIPINDNESIFFEYRNNNVSTYDSMLPGSGLIAYRTNSSVEGNTNGKNQNVNYPDEVYVYRPKISNNDSTNLAKAYLSDTNPYFSHLGTQTSTKSYDSNAIFLTDGSNTGIIVKITHQSDEEISFEVVLNGNGTNKVVDLMVEGETEIFYGEPLNWIVKLKISGFSGYAVADPSTYTVEYDPTKTGIQVATVIYTDENGEKFTKNVTLNIKDGLTVDGFNVISEPSKKEYSVGETSIDLSGLTIAVTYVKEGTKEIKYSVLDADKWLVEGIDLNVSGEYDVKITYLPLERSVYTQIVVVSEIVGIYVADRDTLTIVGKYESMRLNVMGVGRDGQERPLTVDEYTHSDLNKNLLYTQQTITVKYKANTDIQCSKTAFVVDETALSEITVSGNIKTVYNYGEVLTLVGGILNFNFDGHILSVPGENYYSLYNSQFSSTKRGLQSLTVTHYGIKNTFKINLLTLDARILTSGDERVIINSTAGYVVFSEETTFGEAEKMFGSYLNVRFVKTEGGVKYTLKSSVHSAQSLSSDILIELVNDADITVASFKIYLKGDANKDGKVDSHDADGWAKALFKQSSDAIIYLDMDGDGKYTLTDYVLLCQEYGGK